MTALKIHYYIPVQSSFDQLRQHALASIRLRAVPAIAGFKKNGHTVTFGSNCPDIQGLDIAIFGKLGPPDEAFKRDIIWTNEVKFLKSNNTKIVLDYSDHHLGVISNQTDFYKKNIALADHICVPSKKMAELVNPFCNSPIHHITDAIEFETFAPRHVSQSPRKIFWFGAKSNLKYLFSFIEKLYFDEPVILNVLTDAKGIAIFQNTKLLSKTKLHVNLDLWSLDKMIDVALKSDICLIPSDQTDVRKNGVGINRLITALSLGLPVAASLVNSYSEFSNYFVDINSPELSLLMKNPESFHGQVISAQQNIVDQFKLENIETKWAEFAELIT